MNERIIVGAYQWDEPWRAFISSFPNVRIVKLPDQQRCLTVFKPELMLQAETDYVTWVDSDGIFQGNCSAFLYGEPDKIYSRSYGHHEMRTHLYARRPETLATWRSDVNDLDVRRNIPDICTNVVGVSLSHNRAFLEKWRNQMALVISNSAVNGANRLSPYFQTDESVMNSLLAYWREAPEITSHYRLDNLSKEHYIHFAYNPKPWQWGWTSYSMSFYREVMDLIEWAKANSRLPDFEPLPKSLDHSYKWMYRIAAPFVENVFRAKKCVKKAYFSK